MIAIGFGAISGQGARTTTKDLRQAGEQILVLPALLMDRTRTGTSCQRVPLLGRRVVPVGTSVAGIQTEDGVFGSCGMGNAFRAGWRMPAASGGWAGLRHPAPPGPRLVHGVRAKAARHDPNYAADVEFKDTFHTDGLGRAFHSFAGSGNAVTIKSLQLVKGTGTGGTRVACKPASPVTEITFA